MDGQILIAGCLEQLHAQWTRFVRSDRARLLVWRAAQEEAPFIDAFIARECEPDAAETPDLFVQLSTPFNGEAGHADALSRELSALRADEALLPQAALPAAVARAEACSLGAHAQAAARRSVALGPAGGAVAQDDIAALLRALSALRGALIDDACPALLAVWLTPGAVSSWRAYLLWLQRVLHCTPKNLRFLVVDSAADLHYAPLAESTPAHVVVQACELPVFAAIEQLAIDADRGSPDGAFRRLQAQLARRLGTGDLAGAQSTGAAAVALAEQHGWPQLAAFVQLTLAAAYHAADRRHEAIVAYAEAERTGARSEAQERAAGASSETAAYGSRIRLHGNLGQAAVWLSSRAYQGAADAYERSARLAHALGDASTELTAYRLASVCEGALANADAAWEHGMQGVRVGLAMDAETRRYVSLSELAQHMRALTERHHAYSAHRGPLERQLAALLRPHP